VKQRGPFKVRLKGTYKVENGGAGFLPGKEQSRFQLGVSRRRVDGVPLRENEKEREVMWNDVRFLP